jgi:hypothetical protein
MKDLKKLIATISESRKELIELLNKNRHRKASESILDLFGNSYEIDNPVLYAYVNIGPQANMNLPDGYTKVSDSFNEKYPQTEFLYYQLEEGEGDEYEDGESFEFNYPDPYSYLYEQMEGIYVLDNRNKPAYKLTGWKYIRNGELHDFTDDQTYVDSNTWWDYESTGLSDDISQEEWLEGEIEWSRVRNTAF